jgi:hypothetical protein
VHDDARGLCLREQVALAYSQHNRSLSSDGFKVIRWGCLYANHEANYVFSYLDNKKKRQHKKKATRVSDGFSFS